MTNTRTSRITFFDLAFRHLYHRQSKARLLEYFEVKGQISLRIMFEFGDELIIDSYRIPWLIWIQLLAMFLLLILLYYLTITPSNLSLHLSTASASPSATGQSCVNRSLLNANNRHKSQVTSLELARENETRGMRTTTSEVVQRARKPDARQRAEPSTTNEGSSMQHTHHPCHFFGFAKQVFLKCLGIDSTPERHHEKDD
ncbi:hypothetical protein L1987_33826 [Smallanthus sonchifolius]|uniref:Uncharacterized protein n=1 Tax=Smallanthus sonchifolius TaxID=185202 RepID=A0ACB9HRL5_9ASTR|nr:hypothetical protein L1987_33826 [Smallanthus sonchifolius]